MEQIPFVPECARGLSILVVDSDTTSLMSLASMLEKCAYQVTMAELATVAMSMIKKRDRFDLVMADIDMFEVGGLAFLQWLHRKNLPVIVMSCNGSVLATTRAIMEGASACFKKPICLSDLKYIWQYAFKKKRIARNILIRQNMINGEGQQNNATGSNCSLQFKEIQVRKGKGAAGVGSLHPASTGKKSMSFHQVSNQSEKCKARLGQIQKNGTACLRPPKRMRVFEAGEPSKAATKDCSRNLPSMNAEKSAKETGIPRFYSSNKMSQPRPEYAHLWKLLDDEEPGDHQVLPNPADVDLYCKWLADGLVGNNK